ncbi:hypothetical protein DFAR_1560006 [Desulfarculales bacterium]
MAILGSSIFIIFEAPATLSGASFQLLLAGGLMKKAKQA